MITLKKNLVSSHLTKSGSEFVDFKSHRCRQKKEMIMNNEHYWFFVFSLAHTTARTNTRKRYTLIGKCCDWSATNSTRKAASNIFKWDSFEMTNSVRFTKNSDQNAFFWRKFDFSRKILVEFQIIFSVNIEIKNQILPLLCLQLSMMMMTTKADASFIRIFRLMMLRIDCLHIFQANVLLFPPPSSFFFSFFS